MVVKESVLAKIVVLAQKQWVILGLEFASAMAMNGTDQGEYSCKPAQQTCCWPHQASKVHGACI
jgi:hypothetical protein